MIEKLSHVVSTYPPGLIELGGTMLSQISLVIFMGAYLYNTAPSKQYKEVLAVTFPVTFRNFACAFSTNFVLLQTVSWYKGLGFLGWTVSEYRFDNLPLHRFIREFIGSTLVFEVLFYVGHRALHHPRIYKYIHDVHHSFETKYSEHVPFGTFYTHAVEFVYAYLSVVAGAAVQHSHIGSLWFTGIVSNTATMYLHTGRDIPGIMGHELHHSRPKHNYGALGILDYLFGTLYIEKPIVDKSIIDDVTAEKPRQSASFW
ncbi:C-4 methylsterol oxidase [Fusarium albosuccineum]|uniref:C-4 methylsterol oxidase n=1 Tax=Fusarium albosuccineum TaxID=1237068 RepID=A0A8H4KWR3_9HYPO|nr:C-4 methylsterol oxidase [Fusarium albosuccineum]